MTPLLTIMLPTTYDRREQFGKLLLEVWRQVVDYSNVLETEVLFEEDGKEMSIGAKRQLLLERARGVFVVGIDSDDWIQAYYLHDILSALKNHPTVDHVGFIEECTINGEKSLSIFSSSYAKWDENAHGYDHIRCANPKSVIRRSIAMQVGYKDMRYGEDRIFSESVTPLIKSEIFLNRVLYYYIHESSNHNERYGIK